MPTKAPIVTPAVTSKRYLRVTLSPITWMSNIKSIADAAPAVGDAWPVLIFVMRVRKAAVGVAAKYLNTWPARTCVDAVTGTTSRRRREAPEI